MNPVVSTRQNITRLKPHFTISGSTMSVVYVWIYKHTHTHICASIIYDHDMTPLVAQMVKHLPTMRETWVQSLSWEDLLEKEMATHSSILAWKIPWTVEPGRLQSMGSQRVGLTERLHFHFLFSWYDGKKYQDTDQLKWVIWWGSAKELIRVKKRLRNRAKIENF